MCFNPSCHEVVAGGGGGGSTCGVAFDGDCLSISACEGSEVLVLLTNLSS